MTSLDPALDDRPAAKLRSPGEIAAAIPLLCGFRPDDSLVLVSLRGPRKRVGLTVRLDLPAPGTDPAALSDLLLPRLLQDGAGHVVLVVFARERRPDLVEPLLDACRGEGLAVEEALHVDAGRWTSYSCTDRCCAAGGEVPAVPSRLAADAVLSGRAVLPSRADLVASLAPPVLLAAEQGRQAQQAAWRAADDELVALGTTASRARARERCRALLERSREGGPLAVEDAARLAVDLHDVAVRDAVAAWGLQDRSALRALLESAAQQVLPPDDAPLCAVVAWLAMADGDGGLANVALDRALAGDPAQSLALLLREAVDRGATPALVRDVLEDLSAVLSPGRPAMPAGPRPAARRASRRGRR